MFGCGLKCSALMAYGHNTGGMIWILDSHRKKKN